jgi:hypothetical protein
VSCPATRSAPDLRPLRSFASECAARADDALGELLRSGAAHGIAAEALLAIL